MDTGKPKTVIAGKPRQAAEKLLEIFIRKVEKRIKEYGVFYFAISGGKSPEAFYKLLGNSGKAKQLPWDKIHLFWADERLVNPDSKKSNYKLAVDTFISKLELPQKNIHRIPTELRDYETCASAYEKQLRDVFGISKEEVPHFDLILLGMGKDGHIASLFPDSAWQKQGRLAGVVHKQELGRITLAPEVLLAAKQIVVLVTGKGKADTVSKVFNAETNKIRYPVHLLREKSGSVTFLMDKAAAGEL